MSELPFEISAKHKMYTRNNWKRRGMKFNGDFEEWYDKYIHASHCELCSNKFKTTLDRNLDHNHDTGEVRNIICRGCNCIRADNARLSTNTTGYKNIIAEKTKWGNGTLYRFQFINKGKTYNLKASIDINKVIAFRDQYFLEHPEFRT